MNEENIFRIAADGLHKMSMAGFLGELEMEREIKRGCMTSNEFISNDLEDFLNNKSAVQNKYIYIKFKKMYKIFVNASSNNETDEIVKKYIGGNIQKSEFECMSAYSASIIAHGEYISFFESIINDKMEDIVSKKRLSMLLIDSYSKNIELSGKFLGCLLSLLNIANNKEFSITKINQLSLCKKIEILKADEEYFELVKGMDNKIRNAAAHVTYTFSEENMIYILRDRNGEEVFLDFVELADSIYPQVIAFNSAFLYCCRMFAVQRNDFKKFIQFVQLM